MALDPQAAAVLAALARRRPPDDPKEDAAAVLSRIRREYVERAGEFAGEPEPVARALDLTVRGSTEDVQVRLYEPLTRSPEGTPVVVFLHGGGWIMGSPDSHDHVARALCNRAGATVLSVDYRLSPEVRIPAALHDCYAALLWAHGHAAELGGDPTRLVVAGDSAGANLATVVARWARDLGGPPVALQILVYPALDPSLESPSYSQFATGPSITRLEMEQCWALYLGDADPRDPDAAPLSAADLRGLAPALILTSGYDPLRDEGERYAELLRAAGVDVQATRYSAQPHGFLRWLGHVGEAREALSLVAERVAALRAPA